MNNKTSKSSVGGRIKELRMKKKETQKDLANILSTTQNNISKIENGATSLTFDNLMRIAEHYKVSLDYLCKGEGGPELLDTLNKYIHFDYVVTSGIPCDDNSHAIPTFEIESSFYHYLSQVAHAKVSSGMPKNIQNSWIEQAESEFKNSLINDTDSAFISFIPLNKITALNEQREFIKIIEKNLNE